MEQSEKFFEKLYDEFLKRNKSEKLEELKTFDDIEKAVLKFGKTIERKMLQKALEEKDKEIIKKRLHMWKKIKKYWFTYSQSIEYEWRNRV